MINDLTSSPHSSLATGLHAHSSRLIGLESDLATALNQCEELADVQGSPGDWDTACHHQWDHVEDILDVIHGLVSEMNTSIINGSKLGALEACTAWKAIMDEETKLAAALAGMRAQSLKLNEAAHREWQELVLIVESHRKVVRTAAEGFGLRLEAWKEEISLTREMACAVKASPLGADGTARVAYAHNLDQAAVEIEQEQHQVLDLKDDIKAMFMWVESPEERERKNQPVEVQAA